MSELDKRPDDRRAGRQADRHLYLRDRRDRLIDLLGLGETMPLRDLPVAVERLVVPKDTEAGIPIGASQRDCTYALWERSSESLAMRTVDGQTVAADEPGTGDEILLMSPPVTQDVGYRIRSTRQTTGRWVYLHDLAEIKVGFNAELNARVLSGTWLDPDADVHEPQDPRVVDYGTEAEVEVQYSQNGVSYRLVQIVDGVQQTVSQSDVVGNFRTVILRTVPLHDDTELRIRVARTVYGQGDGQNDGQNDGQVEETLLDARLPVVVAPDTDIAVSVQGTHIIDYQTEAVIDLADTQPAVEYRLHARTLAAYDFYPEFPVAGQTAEATVQVAGESDERFTVRRPAHTSAWTAVADYAERGSPASGTGAQLLMPAGTFAEDTIVRVEARKTYTLASGKVVTVQRPVRQVAVVLVRPDTAPALRFQVVTRDGASTGALRMVGGQPGVRYHLSASAGGAEVTRPGYFYERYDQPEVNVGIGLLAIGRDMIVARNPWTELVTPELRGIEEMAIEVDFAVSNQPSGFDGLSAAQRAASAPELPIVATETLTAGTALHVRAVKPRTALWANLGQPVTIEEA